MVNQYYVYMLTNKKNGVLYIGVTNDLIKRVYMHKNHLVDGFTKKYKTDKLVWCESTSDVKEAIKKEKQLKKWNRQWKVRLIEQTNPEWDDLSSSFY